MSTKQFEVTDPNSVKQYNKIIRVAYDYLPKVAIAYQSNWYVVLACADTALAHKLVTKLFRVSKWHIEPRPGRKFPGRMYLKITFNRRTK